MRATGDALGVGIGGPYALGAGGEAVALALGEDCTAGVAVPSAVGVGDAVMVDEALAMSEALAEAASLAEVE